jgi:hypothetical protein
VLGEPPVPADPHKPFQYDMEFEGPQGLGLWGSIRAGENLLHQSPSSSLETFSLQRKSPRIVMLLFEACALEIDI